MRKYLECTYVRMRNLTKIGLKRSSNYLLGLFPF